MNRKLIDFLTILIIKCRKRYCGWCRVGYVLYRSLGHSRIKAYLGAFLISNKYLNLKKRS